MAEAAQSSSTGSTNVFTDYGERSTSLDDYGTYAKCVDDMTRAYKIKESQGVEQSKSLDQLSEKLENSIQIIFKLEMKIKFLTMVSKLAKFDLWWDGMKKLMNLISMKSTYQAVKAKSPASAREGDVDSDIRRFGNMMSSWYKRVTANGSGKPLHELARLREEADEIAVIMREKITSIAQNTANYIRDAENFLLKNQEFFLWNNFCDKVLNERLDHHLKWDCFLGGERFDLRKYAHNADVKRTREMMESTYREVKKDISEMLKRKDQPCGSTDANGERCANSRLREMQILNLSTRRENAQLQLLFFLTKERSQLPRMKELWLDANELGRVELEPFFEDIDVITAKFADAVPILEKRRLHNKKPESIRRRHCAATICTNRESAPRTFRCCGKCQADSVFPRNFYCSEECFVEDGTLVHSKMHEARRLAGVDEATKRKASLQEHGQETDGDDNEEVIFLVDDALDSEDDGIDVEADHLDHREGRRRRRRRICHAFDCRKSENHFRCENHHEDSEEATPVLCCDQCRLDDISPRAFYCSQECFKRDWKAVHRLFHKIRRSKLRMEEVE